MSAQRSADSYATVTRDTLVAAVRKEIGLDISAFWPWLKANGYLQKALSESWDPVFGPGGAKDHLSQPGHGSIRVAPSGKVLRNKCPACGLSHIIFMCHAEIFIPNNLSRSLRRYLAELGSVETALARLGPRLETAHEAYDRERADRLKQILSRHAASGPASETPAALSNHKRLLDLAADPSDLGTERFLARGHAPAYIDKARNEIVRLRQWALSDERVRLAKTAWPIVKGRPVSGRAFVAKTLRDEDLTYETIAELLSDKGKGPAAERIRALIRVRRPKGTERNQPPRISDRKPRVRAKT